MSDGRKARWWRKKYKSDPEFRERQKAYARKRRRLYRENRRKRIEEEGQRVQDRSKDFPVSINGVVCIKLREFCRRIGKSPKWVREMRAVDAFPKGGCIYDEKSRNWVFPEVFVLCLEENKSVLQVANNKADLASRIALVWDRWIRRVL